MQIINAESNRIPQHVRDKALKVLQRVEAGIVRPIYLKHHRREGDLWKIEISFNWRMITSDRESFEVMSHEFYNRLFK